MGEVEVKAQKVYKREVFKKIVKIALLFLLIIISIKGEFLKKGVEKDEDKSRRRNKRKDR